MNKHIITWEDVQNAAVDVADTIKFNYLGEIPDCIVAIARGGLVPATILAYQLDIKEVYCVYASSYNDENKKISLKISIPDIEKLRNREVLLVDDLADTGETLEAIIKELEHVASHIQTTTLFIKSHTRFTPDTFSESFAKDTWLVFPWESEG